ncbi:MAG: ATP-binding protein, partial [Nitrospira sp.]
IYVHNRLAAFVVLGRQPHGEPYGLDDRDLLKGICHHAGMLLAHADLMEERQASAELEALHRFSVFCLHDIKNLAARLSLVAQNAEQHGHDPAFQESAIRTVVDTAKKMTDLISKLSRQVVSPSLGDQVGAIDLFALLDEVVAPFQAEQRIRVRVEGHLDVPIVGVREQIQQVLTNVVLNARHAISEQGEISILVAQSNDSAMIIVKDTGRGVPRAMLGRLFRPSQSSRPGGLGIGLYQCRKIVEAHGGTIHLWSQEGEGTQVTIKLPLMMSRKRKAIAGASSAVGPQS